MRFQSYLRAKTERMKKDKPTDWVIAPDGRGWVRLVQVGGFK